MTGHGKIRLMLYEYVRGELGAGDTRRVEEHVARCADCAGQAAALRSVLKVVPDPANRPSGSLPDSYWTGFANEVMGRIDAGPVRRPGFIERFAARFPGPAVFTGPQRLSGVGRLSLVLAVAAIALIVLYIGVPRRTPDRPAPGTERLAERGIEQSSAQDPRDAAEHGTSQSAEHGAGSGVERTAGRASGGFSPDSLTEFDRRLSDYFRRSKTLLVGVSNLDPGGGERADLRTERLLSRSLLREARYLREGPVDVRSYRLMDDLDQIMIGLANSDSRSAVPTVQVIRTGIETKNLLFKLRMQETAQFQTPFRQASYRK